MRAFIQVVDDRAVLSALLKISGTLETTLPDVLWRSWLAGRGSGLSRRLLERDWSAEGNRKGGQVGQAVQQRFAVDVDETVGEG